MSGIESRFESYVQRLATAVGHADREEPLRGYCSGLLVPGERKSVEPMAALIAPARAGAMHQSMHHFVANAAWDDDAVLAAVRAWTLPIIEKHGPITAWLVDDTGLPKKGKHSVGVGRQYCGQLGKQENCQVAVSLSVASEAASLPVAYRLYLPEDWALDAARRKKAGVPKNVVFQNKLEIALGQIEAALAAGIPHGVVLADSWYGNATTFRDRLTHWGLLYAVGIRAETRVWGLEHEPPPREPYRGRGRPKTKLRRDADHQPPAVKDLARALPPDCYRTVTWRQGTAGKLSSRFAALRVIPSHRDYKRSMPRPEEWLLIEWPIGEKEPTKYFLSTLPASTSITRLVATVKLRWRIERDYLELKQEVGLGHFEGRGWRGFHHHAVLSIAAYGFLISERSAIPPSGPRWRPKAPRRPRGFRPRGTPDPARAPHAELNRDTPQTNLRLARKPPAAMSVLSAPYRAERHGTT